MIDRSNIRDLTRTVDDLAAATQKLKDATVDERDKLYPEFRRLLALTEAMILDLNERAHDCGNFSAP